MELDGPQLLGKGGYGCTFSPKVPCKKSKLMSTQLKKHKGRLVGKVMLKDEAEIELNIATVIRGIPGYERYYLIPEEEDNCSQANFKKIKEKYTAICPLFRQIQDNQMSQIISKYGGKSMNDLQITDSFDYLNSFKHVLEGVAKLNKQGICHMDIKKDNLLVDMYGTIRLIDFGISFLGDISNQTTVDQHLFPFYPEYDGFSPEISVHNGLVKGMQLSYLIQQTILQKKIFVTAATVIGLNLKQQEDSLRNFWETDTTWLGNKGWALWYQTYWRVWDSWAVGVVFLKLLQKCFLVPSFIKNVWPIQRDKITLVLKGVLQANPKLRLTSEEALSILNA